MPQTQAATKALRAAARRRVFNDRWRKKMKTALYALRDAMVAKDKTAAQAALTDASSVLDRAARRHIIPANKAARKKSRLQKAVSQLA